MIQHHSRKIWARETRSRALVTTWISNAALLTLWLLFNDTLAVSPIFYGFLAAGALIQLRRLWFLTRSESLDDKLWLRQNDLGLMLFAAYWFCLSLWVASQSDQRPEHAALNAFMIIIATAYLSSSPQFSAYRRRSFYFYLVGISTTMAIFTSYFGRNLVEQILLASLPLMYAALQIRTRNMLWRAIFSVGDRHIILHEAINTLPCGVSVLRNGRYEIVNGYAAQLMDRSAREVADQAIGFSGSDAEFAEIIERFIASEVQLECFEQKVATVDGPRDHLVLVRRVANTGTETDDIIVIALDIEPLSQKERELEAAESLAERAFELAREAAGAITAPLRTLQEQVLVNTAPDPETTREALRSIQLSVNKMKQAEAPAE